MFTNLLNRVIVWVYGVYKYMVTMPDYYIENVNMLVAERVALLKPV